MNKEFVLYQKFTDIESAEDFSKELKENQIEYLLQDNNHAYGKVVGYNTIDIAIGVNLKPEDFVKADEILDKYYNRKIQNIDKSYYLFDFTDDELKEIILNPFDWGRLDYLLAKHILSGRGIDIKDSDINIIKNKKIDDLRQTEKESILKIISGYFLAIIFPLLAIIPQTILGNLFSFLFPLCALLISITIKYNRKILPNGEKFYINTEQDRKHGQWIFIISLISVCIFFIRFIYEV